MKLADTIGGAIDRFIGVFSPQSELKRKIARHGISKIRTSKYAAAQTDRLTGPWSPANTNVNEVIGNSAPTVRARIRQLVRDFPYFARAINNICDYTVGAGIRFQSRIKDDAGKLNKKRIQQVEDAFNFWADQADIAGKLHYYEMMELAKRQEVESGEFILVKTSVKQPGRYLPYGLQMFEADWLASYITRPASADNDITQGIEYNKNTGQVAAYHFTDPDSWGKPKRVPAENVIHGFKTLRPGQLRGISSFTPAVLLAHSLSEYMEAEIDTAKMAAKYLAFIKTPSPFERQTNVTTDSETSQKIDELETAIIEYLRPGEEVEIASNPKPGTNFPPFVRLILTMLSISTGVPYEILSGDYQGMNYSTARIVRNDFSQQLKPIIIRHVRHFGMATFVPFMEFAVLSGKLDLPGYFINPWPYLESHWQPPGMESVDPLRETKARIEEVSSGLRSPQEVVGARGRDLEDVYKEIATARVMADELDLSFELKKPSTALANNPAAVGKGDVVKLQKIGGDKNAVSQ